MRPLADAIRDILLRAIAECDDPSDRKWRITYAYERGAITAAEAADWLRIYGLEAA